jgi:cation transport ATPase
VSMSGSHHRAPGQGHSADASRTAGGHGGHNGHDHEAMIADFRRRFWVSLALTVPILLLSPMIQRFLGLDEKLAFPGDVYVLFGLASVVYFWGGWPFLAGIARELRARRPGMMTLIALAISVAYFYSSAVVFDPQYVGFILIMFGFLLQWPTLLTLVMFPVLVWMYVRLARSEEREAEVEFGETYRAYARRVPAFLPRLSSARIRGPA